MPKTHEPLKEAVKLIQAHCKQWLESGNCTHCPLATSPWSNSCSLPNYQNPSEWETKE